MGKDLSAVLRLEPFFGYKGPVDVAVCISDHPERYSFTTEYIRLWALLQMLSLGRLD